MRREAEEPLLRAQEDVPPCSLLARHVLCITLMYLSLLALTLAAATLLTGSGA